MIVVNFLPYGFCHPLFNTLILSSAFYYPHLVIHIIFCHPRFIFRINAEDKSAFFHPHFTIRILSSAFYHPHFIILILSAFYHPHILKLSSAFCHPPSAAIQSSLYRDPKLRPQRTLLTFSYKTKLRKFHNYTWTE